MRTPLDASAHEAGLFQDLDVFRSGGEGHAVRRRQLADIVFAGGETAQHRASSSVGERMEDTVERGGAFLKHVTEPTAAVVARSTIWFNRRARYMLQRLLWLASVSAFQGGAMNRGAACFIPRICRNVKSCTTLPAPSTRLRSMGRSIPCSGRTVMQIGTQMCQMILSSPSRGRAISHTSAAYGKSKNPWRISSPQASSICVTSEDPFFGNFLRTSNMSAHGWRRSVNCCRITRTPRVPSPANA